MSVAVVGLVEVGVVELGVGSRDEVEGWGSVNICGCCCVGGVGDGAL